ncbi:hypothetical protein [Thalassobellus citreus]|uniref:hypothetical protein n=1 Tax=Thalassobellus citreus TaxID=3367752 RepID=UPI0037A5D88A
MKNNKHHSVFTSNENNCLFTEQFDSWKKFDWNEDMPPYFKRLNEIDDDRSFVILACSVMEYQIDRFLNLFIPNPKILINNKTSLNNKILIIQAFKIIPPHFVQIMNVLRNIRNDFAHNLNIDSFLDSAKSEKLPENISEMERLWKKFESDMCYWNNGDSLRLMYKDLWQVCIEGLRVYESNIRLFRQETEKVEFINHLSKLSTELMNKREEKEQEKILKTYMPWRK